METWNDNVLSWRKGSGKKFRIAVAGDICPARAGAAEICAGKTGEILQSIQPVLDRADLRLAQWEVVLTNEDTPILKCGPNLKCDPGCVDFLKKGNFEVALLANNHTGDYGENGVLSTLEVLKKAKIRTVGAGKDAATARKVLRMTKNSFAISIFNFCEYEFGCAWGDHAGANPTDPLDNLQQVRDEKYKADIILVVMHGGNEYCPVPSPRVKQLCRAFAEAGASAVMNIHTHCPQGIEVVKGVPIVYCPGNFFFPYPEDKYDPASFWWSGYLPTFEFDRTGACSVEVTPYIMEHTPLRVTALTGEQRKWFLDYLQKISREMQGNGDHWYDIWCAYRYDYPFMWIHELECDALRKDPEDADALQKLPAPRHMYSCQAHCELARRIMLLLERKEIKKLQKEIPALEELRTARFAELKK
ncbi:MAG: CapA family protein [Lentisphaeria bacterium]|nr:CapA family protein [Lentisphaeria bacterium]